jgi:beta-phosphoglucomutase-like phosphatase (HAD superfamily)
MRNDPEAMIFDLDGVITFTARLHAAAWKELFDEFLKERSVRLHQPYRKFTVERDYLTYVDGKPATRELRASWTREGFLFPTETLPILLPPRLCAGSEIAKTTFSTKKSDNLEWMLTTMPLDSCVNCGSEVFGSV